MNRRISSLLAPAILLFAAIVIGCSLTRVLQLNLLVYLYDEYAHLLKARFLIDSVTPGISQLGFWPPLLHILMAPVVAASWLFFSGFAGSVVLIPVFLVGVLACYSLCRSVFDDEWTAAAATLLYVLTPGVLYYAVVPMTEVLFISCLFITAWLFDKWTKTHSIKHLSLMAAAAGLAGFSRLEGLPLLPALGCAVLFVSWREKFSFAHTKGLFGIFLFVAFICPTYYALYSYAYGGSTLTFIRSNSAVGSTEGAHADAPYKWQMIALAIRYDLGQVAYWLLPWAVVSLAFLKRNYYLVHLLFLAPVCFVLYVVHSQILGFITPVNGSFQYFHNDRYILCLICCVVFAFGALLSFVPKKWIVLRRVYQAVVALPVLSFAAFIAYQSFYVHNLDFIRNNVNKPFAPTFGVIDPIREQYKNDGKILLQLENNDHIVYGLQLPLKTYIYEANFPMFDHALAEPWCYAKYVLVNRAYSRFSSEFATLAEDPAFKKHYMQVFSEEGIRFFELTKIPDCYGTRKK